MIHRLFFKPVISSSVFQKLTKKTQEVPQMKGAITVLLRKTQLYHKKNGFENF